jgi:acyl-[acyl carrier protein]--UDP-N-acetylglucosamine O-acyltransferase
MGPEEIHDVRNAYRTLYGSDSLFATSIRQLPEQVTTAAGRRLVEFLQQDSKRGIAGRYRRRSPEGGDGIAG